LPASTRDGFVPLARRGAVVEKVPIAVANDQAQRGFQLPGQLTKEVRMKRLLRRMALVMSATILSACGDLPVTYHRSPSSPELAPIPTATLERIKAERLTSVQIESLLGPPDASLEGDTPAIAYSRCETRYGKTIVVVLMVPTPIVGDWSESSCQVVGIWFDAEGRAATVRTESGSYEDYGQLCALRPWLESGEYRSCHPGDQYFQEED
jgi:hypothetical protein